MVDAPLRACDFRRFLCVFTGDPKIHARRRGGGGGEGLKAVQGPTGGGFSTHGFHRDGLRFAFTMGLEKLAPMYTDIEPMMTFRLTTRIDYIPYLRLVNFSYGVILRRDGART
jgi:hypothetical protein